MKKRAVGYVLFAIACLLFWLYATFPYRAVQERITLEAAAQGIGVTMDSLGPGLLGVRAKNVKVWPKASASGPPFDGEPLVLSSVSFRPSLLPPGIAVSSSAFGGSIRAAWGGIKSARLDVSFDGLDPSQGNLKAVTGLDLSGEVSGDLSLSAPYPDKGPKEPDLSRADGLLTLKTEGLTVNGGSVTVPMYGQPTPIDLPKVTLGELEGRVKIDKGVGTLEKLSGQSSDLSLQASGTVKLNKRPEYSELNVDVKLKADPEFTKRLGILGAGISVLPPDKTDTSFRTAKLTGYLGRPNFGPGR
jgi:type II secretion system protein N